MTVGQKVHPVGCRIGVIYDWESRWYADGKKYAKYLHNDLELREWIRKRWDKAGVSRVEIERIGNVMRFTVWAARPGVVIGKQGAEIQAVREELQAKTGSRVMINIQEIKNPDAEAQVVAEGVAAYERRISFRRNETVYLPCDEVGREGHQDPVRRPSRRLRSPVRNGILKGSFLFQHLEQTLITVLPKPIRSTVSLASRFGSIKAKSWNANL